MTAISQTDILFDDFSMLTKLIGQKELKAFVPNSNCDCAGYTATPDDENIDTDQIASSSGQAN